MRLPQIDNLQSLAPRQPPGMNDIQRRLNSHNAARLNDAIMQRQRDVVAEILGAKADPNNADEKGRLALYTAAYTGVVDIVRQVLDAKADANLAEKTQTGGIPLQLAAWQGHAEVTRVLLECSAKPNAADGKGWTPLCSAAEQGHAAAVEVLLSHGADPSKAAKLEGKRSLTPLQAAQQGRQQASVVRILREAIERGPQRASSRGASWLSGVVGRICSCGR